MISPLRSSTEARFRASWIHISSGLARAMVFDQTQDCRPGRPRGGPPLAVRTRRPGPLAAAAPTRLETVFVHAPEVECTGFAIERPMSTRDIEATTRHIRAASSFRGRRAAYSASSTRTQTAICDPPRRRPEGRRSPWPLLSQMPKCQNASTRACF
jgi:hypothetical protein